MGVVKVDLANFVTIGLIAFLFIFIWNYAVRRIGFPQVAV